MGRSIKEILEDAETIAIIGCSKQEHRTSHQIASYLQESGYRIIPIHPEYDEILGEKVYPTMLEIPEDFTVDVADIFRNSKYTAEMVDQIIEYFQSTGQEPVVWTQLDVSSDEAEQKAEEAGLTYVKNKCMMVEHEKHVG